MVSPSDLHKVLRLDADTGQLYWLDRDLSDFPKCRAQKAMWVKWQSTYAGKPALTSMSRGYFRGRVFGRQFLVHRVVWAMTHGEWPNHGIDHINGVKTDNRPTNLRDVPQSENARNTRIGKKNTSGTLGVSWDKGCKKWAATIRQDGRQRRIGLFVKKDDAVRARKEAEQKIGYHKNHGRAV